MRADALDLELLAQLERPDMFQRLVDSLACGQPETLIPLGSRDDHSHRWRLWSTAITLLYLCERCDVLLEVDAAPEPRRSPRRIGSVHSLSVLRPPSVRSRRGQDTPQWGV
jgi:hypothetical protein